MHACPRKLRRNWPPLHYIGYSRRDVTSLHITTQMRVILQHTRVNDTKKLDRPCLSFEDTSILDLKYFIHAEKFIYSFQIRQKISLFYKQNNLFNFFRHITFAINKK